MVHAHERAVDPDLLGGLGQLDRLVEGVSSRMSAGARRVLPVPEAQEADAFAHVRDARDRVLESRWPPGVAAKLWTFSARSGGKSPRLRSLRGSARFSEPSGRLRVA